MGTGTVTKVLAFAAVVLCFILYAWTVWYERSLKTSDPRGFRNVKSCRQIAPGVTEAGLVSVLGAPERVEEAGGIRRLSFHTLSVAASLIQADVEASTGKVLVLRCTDGAPMWILPP